MVNCHFGEFIGLYLRPTTMTMLFVRHGPHKPVAEKKGQLVSMSIGG